MPHDVRQHKVLAIPALALMAVVVTLLLPSAPAPAAGSPTLPALSSAAIGFQAPVTDPPGVSFRTADKAMVVNGRPAQSPVTVALRDGVTCVDIPTLNRFLGITFTGEEATKTVSYSFFGLSVVSKIGSREAQGPGGAAIPLPCSPFVAGSAVYFPARPLVQALGMSYSETPDRIEVSAGPAHIVGVRYNEDAQRFRTVIELAEPTPFFAVAAPSVISVGLQTESGFVPEGAVTRHLDSRGQPVDDGPPPKITLETKGVLSQGVTIENMDQGFVRIGAHGTYEVVEPLLFTLAAPTRIVLDFPKQWERKRVEDPWQGIQYTWYSIGTADGPVIAHVLYAKGGPDSPVRPIVGLAGRESRARQPLSSISRGAGALAGVNGGYFAPTTGDPIGLLIAGGEWVRFPYQSRTALLISRSGQLAMGRYGCRGVVTVGQRSFGVDGLNEWIRGEGNGLKILTRRWGPSWAPAPGQMCVQVRSGAVTGVVAATTQRGPEVPIPDDGFLIVSQGERNKAALINTPSGTRVGFQATLEPSMDGVLHGLGGGPAILKGGQWVDAGRAEGFGSDITVGRNPRTGIGIT
ncbi:MAG: hypothetical protein GF320_02020, partial [Armatimonadia bacterium]|nr:hypothetical protein [Armatimonadia bacterium]